ncbi:perosamine synthetase [Lachnospiraceae bacterium NE2001]|nr:perosamine synthetase [Lachnospiraceae bacterium NE2001]
MFIPLSIPNLQGNERIYADDALKQGWVSTGGAYITEFERKLADYLKVQNVAACQSGTSAIHLSLIEAGVNPGDVVIVPPLTFIAAVNPVKYQFAKPVFIDCDDSFCLDPVKLNEFCERECVFDGNELKYQGDVVKAIIIVHVFGNMADMISIMKIADKYKIKVIEDSTEALGTHYIEGKFGGKYAGTIGDFGAYSFNGNKIITTGGGGAVTSNNSSLVDHMRYLSTQAKDDPHYYIHHEIGYNYRMTNLQAAVGVAQMEELQGFIEKKNKNFELYQSEFEGFKYANLIPFREGVASNKWFYSLLINRQYIRVSLRDIIQALDFKGIQTRAIWGLINEQKPFVNEVSYKLEKAPYYANCIINIPSSTQITVDEIKVVSYEIRKLLGEMAYE